MAHIHRERRLTPPPPERVRAAQRRAARTAIRPAGGGPAAPQTAIALQRAAGNAAVNRLLGGGPATERTAGQQMNGQAPIVQRAPAATAAPATGGRQVGGTLRAIEERFQQIQADNPQLAHEQRASFERFYQVISEFDGWMRQSEIGYRFGGSISAFLQGANRIPHDIDVEVSNGDNMRVLFRLMHQPGSGWVATPHERDGDLVVITAQHTGAPGYDFDIVSEARGFDSPFVLHESMQLEGSAVESGRMMPREELILNYLDRMLQKPGVAEFKGDAAQIADLLRAEGCRTRSDVEAYWHRTLEPTTRPGDRRKTEFVKFLERIATERFGATEPTDVDATARSGSPEPMDVD